MADVTVTVAQSLAFRLARHSMLVHAVRIPFAPGYVFDKIDGKVKAELAAYDKAEQEQLAIAKANGHATVMENGNYRIHPEGAEAFNAALDALRNESITLTNVRQVRLSEMGDVALSPMEMAGLAPFLTDDPQ